MTKKILLKLVSGDDPQKLKGLENKTITGELESNFEGGAIFPITYKVVINAIGDFVFKEGRRHVYNLSKYLSGKDKGTFAIRIYDIS